MTTIFSSLGLAVVPKNLVTANANVVLDHFEAAIKRGFATTWHVGELHGLLRDARPASCTEFEAAISEVIARATEPRDYNRSGIVKSYCRLCDAVLPRHKSDCALAKLEALKGERK